VVANVAKIVSDFSFPRRISRRLLHDNPLWVNETADAQHIGPEACACPPSVDGCGNTGLLARRASDDDIGLDSSIHELDVIFYLDPRKPELKDLATNRVDLAETHSVDAGALKANRVTTDAGKKIDRFHVRSLLTSGSI
jgi:hypothetical protein